MAPAERPLALARLHRELPGGASISVRAGRDRAWLLEGAGFEPRRAVRLRTLPDLVGPGMRLHVCGLNPSLFAADAGVNFARPGNRFWPAAVAAGVVTRDRDPWHALVHDGVGFTDLVKRATIGATELSAPEYEHGARRLAWLVRLVQPAAVCFVGLTGWRAAVAPGAAAGWQQGGFAGAPAYVMPNTSGLNAHTKPAEFAAHLRTAARPPGPTGRRG